MREPQIRCPQCKWRPSAEDRWVCMPGCTTRWNTFWTAGLCPGCLHHWQHTQCPSCSAISPHRDWYQWPLSASPLPGAADAADGAKGV